VESSIIGTWQTWHLSAEEPAQCGNGRFKLGIPKRPNVCHATHHARASSHVACMGLLGTLSFSTTYTDSNGEERGNCQQPVCRIENELEAEQLYEPLIGGDVVDETSLRALPHEG
jgi:hypothetical protein